MQICECGIEINQKRTQRERVTLAVNEEGIEMAVFEIPGSRERCDCDEGVG